MEWTESIRAAIDYMEKHLLDAKKAEDVANEVAMSYFYLQRGFKIMTGYSLTEYIRNRRLYLAALDVMAKKEKIIDIAYKYGYETPESFTKAFTRFHGASPTQFRKGHRIMQVFLPLKINIIVQGGYGMDYVVEKRNGFRVIGFGRNFAYDCDNMEIPGFWDEFMAKYGAALKHRKQPDGAVEETVFGCRVGEYGVCIDDLAGKGMFRYLIAGEYTGGEVPEGMEIFEFPDLEWVKFTCKGPMPGALQTVNNKVFKEWLPGNSEFEIALPVNIEWYSCGDNQSPDYESSIWVPVKRK